MQKKNTLIILLISLIGLPFFLQDCTSTEVTGNPVNSHYQGDLPWEKSPFKASSESLQTAAGTIKLDKEQDVRIFLREWSFNFDKQDRLEKRYRHVYQILSANGIQNWASMQVSWDPWYQEKPLVRVRVSNPDGREYFLEPAHIIENAAREQDSQVFSERRSLRAPYPNIIIGSIVEEEILIIEKATFTNMGDVKRIFFSMNHPVHVYRTVIDVPDGLPFKYRLYLLPQLQPRIQNLNNGKRYIFELKDVPPDTEIENSLPPDVPCWPALAFSTGISWQELATRYSMLVDEKLKNENLSAAITQCKAADLQTTVINCVKWINGKVRYTGLELGENSIVPSQPAETLKRGFGDCKDKATLLVGMLRQAGYKAYVALLNAGTNWDIDDELPGLGQFNHAIVFVEEGKGFWIDPTAEYSRDALLPLTDQNRLALIAAPTTVKPVKTIKYESGINRIVIEKNFTMKNDGYADVRETTTYFGVHEEYQRYRYLGADKEKLAENFKKYIDYRYRFGDLDKWDVNDPTDLSKPFQISLQIKKAGRAITEGNKASLAILVDEITSFLPDTLTDEPKKEREGNFTFFAPSVYEINYTITPPPGFIYKNIPSPETITLGTCSLEKKFSTDKNKVYISLKLDTGKERLTAREFKKTNSALLDFLKQKLILVELEHEGEILLAAGDYKGSLASFQSFCRQAPDEVVHFTRYAAALLRAGLGEKAREIAQQALKLDPNSAAAYATLGWILEHDLLGRRFQPGFDRQGALAAYKKAIELDNKNSVYRFSFAILSEHDEQGFRYSPQANINDAIAAYEYVIDELKEKNGKDNLLFALLYAGQYEELQKRASTMDEEAEKNIFLITAIAAKEGIDSALKEAAKIGSSEQRKQIFIETSNLLIRLRLYPQAVTLLREAARGSNDAVQIEARADMLQKLKVFSGADDSPRTVESVIQSYLYAFLTADGKDFASINELVTPGYYTLVTDPSFRDNLTRNYTKLKNAIISSNYPLAFYIDTTLSTIKLSIDGDKNTGYRVKLNNSELSGQLENIFFLDIVNGKPVIIGSRSTDSLLGKYIYELYKNGQSQKAAQWLDWYFEDNATFNARTNEALSGQPFQKFWNKELKETEYAALAVMSSGKPCTAEAIQLLETAYKTETKQAEKNNLLYALQQAYVENRNNSKALAMAGKLYEIYPESETAFSIYTRSLIFAKDFEKAEKIIKARLDKDLGDKAANNAMFFNYAYQLNLSAMHEQLEKCQKYNSLTASEFNLAAWAELFGDELDPKALEYARTAVMRTNGGSAAILHTIATLYAETNRCEEARKLISQVMNVSGNDEPESDDWYVIGRIAEQYGEMETANKAYRRVEKPQPENTDYLDTYTLAARRLKILEAAPTP